MTFEERLRIQLQFMTLVQPYIYYKTWELPMKKIKFDLSEFGCNEGAVKKLIEAMGFEIEKESKEVIARPGDIVSYNTYDGKSDKRIVVSIETHKRNRPSFGSFDNRLPNVQMDGTFRCDKLEYYKLNGKFVTQYIDD